MTQTRQMELVWVPPEGESILSMFVFRNTLVVACTHGVWIEKGEHWNFEEVKPDGHV